MYLLAAISLGLMSSLHCVAMCSPFQMAVLPYRNHFGSSMMHQSGRIFVYVLLGAVAGGIGASFSLFAEQQLLSMAVGALMVLAAGVLILSKQSSALTARISQVSIKAASWIHTRNLDPNLRTVLLGMVNGLLPCGMVYLAMVGASTTFTPWDGALFMLVFGLGTMPALLGVSLVKKLIPAGTSLMLRRMMPVVLMLVGGLLIMRGMAMDIPLLSPGPIESPNQVTNCE